METYYSNVFEAFIGPYDYAIVFGLKNSEQYKTRSIEFDKLAMVYMSHEQTKTLLIILKELLDKYESDMGEVNLPPEYRKRYHDLFNQINIGGE